MSTTHAKNACFLFVFWKLFKNWWMFQTTKIVKSKTSWHGTETAKIARLPIKSMRQPQAISHKTEDNKESQNNANNQ
jgi:hypothetical protein